MKDVGGSACWKYKMLVCLVIIPRLLHVGIPSPRDFLGVRRVLFQESSGGGRRQRRTGNAALQGPTCVDVSWSRSDHGRLRARAHDAVRLPAASNTVSHRAAARL